MSTTSTAEAVETAASAVVEQVFVTITEAVTQVVTATAAAVHDTVQNTVHDTVVSVVTVVQNYTVHDYATAVATATATAATTVYVHDSAPVPEPTGWHPAKANAFAWKYLAAYGTALEAPTYRYAYLFWLFILLLTALYAVAHHLRLSGGAAGMAWSKWGMKRYSIRFWPRKWGRPFVLPSNSYLCTFTVVCVMLVLLSTIGPDFVDMSKPTWDFSPMDATKRSLGSAINEARAHEAARRLARAAANEAKRALADTTPAAAEVTKAWWAQGNRWGFMAFAAFPLVVLLALKSAPFAIFTLPWFTALHWDKVGTLHRMLGWAVWWMVTVHVVTWTVQLAQDYYDGRIMWFAVFTVYRFRFGCAAYAAMTLAMVLSTRKVRDKSYEVFYGAHVTLMGTTMVCALIHHPTIWYWMAISMLLWAGDRSWRYVRYLYHNGVGTPKAPPNTSSIASDKSLPLSVSIPAGMAHAQLLPSRTVRLTIHTPRPLTWKPGQSVLLHLPELSEFQSHPFTIASNDASELVCIIKGRKGLTRKLYDFVYAKAEADMRRAGDKEKDKRSSVVPHASPVFLRAKVDGPMGSSGRVRWNDYASVLIFVGGSGVTFGLAITDFLSKEMAGYTRTYTGKTTRVRFVWIVREYAEITWAAGAMCRFKNLLPDARLQIDIFVTNGERSARPERTRLSMAVGGSRASRQSGFDSQWSISLNDPGIGSGDFMPPRPQFKEEMRRDSCESLASVYSNASGVGPADQRAGRGYYEGVDPETQLEFDDVIGLTNYADEVDIDDPVENSLSHTLQHEGRLRRAKSRRVARRRAEEKAAGIEVPDRPVRKRPSMEGIPRISISTDEADLQIDDLRAPRRPALGRNSGLSSRASSIRGTDTDTDAVEQLETWPGWPSSTSTSPTRATAAGPRSTSSLSRLSHTRSDSVNSEAERYEPFGSGAGPCPSPSLSFDDEFEGERHSIFSLSSRTQSMVLLEDTKDSKAHTCADCGRAGSDILWIDEADYAAAKILSESARTGRPPMASIVEEELRIARGATIIATCGPGGLTTTVRKLVSKAIDPARVHAGDDRGRVTMYSEDFEM